MVIQTQDPAQEIVLLPELLEAERRASERRGRPRRSEEELRRILWRAAKIVEEIRARGAEIDEPPTEPDDPYRQRNLAWKLEHGSDWMRYADFEERRALERCS